MRALMFLACILIYYGIIAVLVKDAMEQIRGRRGYGKIERKPPRRRFHL